MDDWGVVAAPRDCLESDARTRSHSESSAKSSNLCVVFRAQRFWSAGRLRTAFLNGRLPAARVDPSPGEVTWMIGE
jgi:hypothetical protein